jgi:hypothetical protein
VLQLFPHATWLAAVTSAALLVMMWAAGDLAPRSGVALRAWFLAAGCCQFVGPSVTIAACGVALQTCWPSS